MRGHLRKCFVSLSLVLIAAFITGSTAEPKCGTAGPPNYNDIESVLLTNDYRLGDAFRDQTHPVSNLASSTYWMFFWETGPAHFPTVYSQFTLRDQVGTYHLNATLAEARNILKNDRFFDLAPRSYLTATEQTFSVLTVLRCAVVTRIIMDNDHQLQDAATAKTFEDMNSLLSSSVMTKVSASATDFQQLRLFDP